jgi:hypothetical protein
LNFSPALVCQSIHDPSRHGTHPDLTDSGMLAPLIGSLAETDKEIGVQLGICFTFTGMGCYLIYTICRLI